MKRGLRLMLVTDAVGGVWTYSVELARALRAWDVETVLAVIGPSPSVGQRREAAGVELIDTGLALDWTAERPDAVRRTGRGLAGVAEREGVDIVQLGSASLLADCDFSQPVVVVQHSCVATWWDAVREGPLPRDFAWRRDLVECGLNVAQAVVAPSASFAASLARVYGLSRSVRCVHNGRRALPMKKRPPEDFVFTVGRLWDDGKNVRVLDETAGRLKVPVEAIGPLDGPNGTEVSFDHLRTPGELRLDKIAHRLAARPIFASPALYEPFGLSVLEAAQAGCALVLSDIPTFRELWDGSALFVDPNDASGFAKAIEQLLARPERRSELGLAARVRALRYTPEAMGSRMAQLYDDLVAQPSRESVSQPSAFSQFAGAAS
jgi:glycosyltransferase involved in cell wall biosynthesis